MNFIYLTNCDMSKMAYKLPAQINKHKIIVTKGISWANGALLMNLIV